MDYIAHHGIKGQKWGVRRYQNPDGTLTDAGKKRARMSTNRATVPETKRSRELLKASVKSASKNSMLTNKEIAKRFGITEAELKSLLYE